MQVVLKEPHPYHYAYRTEQTYCQRILRYIRFHGGNIHPRELSFMGHADVKTTEIYAHAMGKDISRLVSPLDGFDL